MDERWLGLDVWRCCVGGLWRVWMCLLRVCEDGLVMIHDIIWFLKKIYIWHYILTVSFQHKVINFGAYSWWTHERGFTKEFGTMPAYATHSLGMWNKLRLWSTFWGEIIAAGPIDLRAEYFHWCFLSITGWFRNKPAHYAVELESFQNSPSLGTSGMLRQKTFVVCKTLDDKWPVLVPWVFVHHTFNALSNTSSDMFWMVWSWSPSKYLLDNLR